MGRTCHWRAGSIACWTPVEEGHRHLWSIAPSAAAGAPTSASQAGPAAARVAGWSQVVTDGSSGAST